MALPLRSAKVDQNDPVRVGDMFAVEPKLGTEPSVYIWEWRKVHQAQVGLTPNQINDMRTEIGLGLQLFAFARPES